MSQEREGKKPDPKKYIGHDTVWHTSMEAVMAAERHYAKHLFDIRDDVTRKQATEEFWERIAESWGFKIDSQRES